ncbi:MAG: hypothetical protein M1395_09240 [Bacteroidetes bacterium]|jgi:hypothetical protein|nr:hypothetical protein [Bacteroidota bacterium]
MAINPIDPMPNLGNAKEVKKKVNSSEENTAQNVSDKVELSPEAKKLHEVQMQNRLSDIRGKVESGFYNSDEVLNSVANSLVKVIQSK